MARSRSVLTDETIAGPRELQSHGEREEAAQQEENERGDHEAPRHGLVVDSGEPAQPARGIAPCARKRFGDLPAGSGAVHQMRGRPSGRGLTFAH